MADPDPALAQQVANANALQQIKAAQLATAKDQASLTSLPAANELQTITTTAQAVKALLPSGSGATPLTNTVKADPNSGVVAETVAYALLDAAAKEFVEKARRKLSHDARVVILRDPQLVNTDWTYVVVTTQIGAFIAALDDMEGAVRALQEEDAGAPRVRGREGVRRTQTYDLEAIAPTHVLNALSPTASMVGTAAAVGISALPSIVGAAADLAGYFASDYSVSPFPIAATADPLLTALASAFSQNGITVSIDGFGLVPAGSVLEDFQGLLKKRWLLSSLVESLVQGPLNAATAKVTELTTQLASAQTASQAVLTAAAQDADAKERAQEEVTDVLRQLLSAQNVQGHLKALSDAVSALISQIDQFAQGVTSAPSGGGIPALAQAQVRALIHAESDQLHILQASISSIAGESQTRTRLFVSPRTRYVATCTVNIVLADPSGDVVCASEMSLIGELAYRLKSGACVPNGGFTD